MWILLAILASLFWGLCYTLEEQAFKKISISTFMAITCLVTSLVMGTVSYFSGSMKTDLEVVKTEIPLIASGVGCFVIANTLIALSIQSKNATLAGLLEVSYPIFTILFAYLLYRENQLSLSTLIGGGLIFAGVFVVSYFNS